MTTATVHVIIVSYGLIPEVGGVFTSEEDARKSFIEACRSAAFSRTGIFRGRDDYYRYTEPKVDGHMTKTPVDEDDVSDAIDKELASWYWSEWGATGPHDAWFASDGDEFEVRWDRSEIDWEVEHTFEPHEDHDHNDANYEGSETYADRFTE